MERDSPSDGPGVIVIVHSSELTNDHSPEESPLTTHARSTISDDEFSCPCCYDILVDPTTLNCGHNFCRHCLALWWESLSPDSPRKNECPECRQKCEGFPKVNILLRDATDNFFSEIVQRRRAEIQADPKISHSLLAFQRNASKLQNWRRFSKTKVLVYHFFSGVLSAFTCVAVMLLVYHWDSGETDQHDPLFSKPVTRWTSKEVLSWLEHLGPWAQLYREPFRQENVNGQLLLTLGEKELSRPNFNIENEAQRRAILFELDRLRTLGRKPTQNLWEYKAVNARKSLFLLYGLKNYPRLTLFYLYLFDYLETFLPFMHRCCPEQHVDNLPFFTLQSEPTWHQWAEFLVMYLLHPYQLIAKFAWDWLAIHYWTSRFIIINAMLLSVLEVCALWSLWKVVSIRTLPVICVRMWSHLWKISLQGFAIALFWPLIPQFVYNCLFYWALYVPPILPVFVCLKRAFKNLCLRLLRRRRRR